MSTATAVRRTFGALKRRFPASVVAVVSAGRSAEGLRAEAQQSGNPELIGESGIETALVHVDTADVDQPVVGEDMTVGGDAAIVRGVKRDPTGALYRIEYQIVREVE